MSEAGACGSTRCVTCADEGVPMRVLAAATDGVAPCAGEDGEAVEVLVELVGEVEPGALVLVHAGTALALLEADA